MGFYRKLNDREDVNGGTTSDALEEQYQQMFKKIARDFVFRGDLKVIFNSLFKDLIEDDDEAFNSRFDAAVLKAMEYRDNLNKSLDQRTKYKDVIDDE